ncbi:allantoate permease [Ophiocordyceps sinensis CO18]|uniref:Allantoate permease n=1 Tax=Ophiocordyceps sinensis (strain Co18 / CGMCC 3.14243) TaxID=911162 RepID=T5AR38_OPHSC|nr:allantoate permease [Ophiocordyceps sinensis CO18]
MQFLDKVILNYAAVMGLAKDLDLRGNDFSNIATFLFVGLVCFEVPNIYFLQRFPAAKWLGLNVTLWGVATACGAAATSYRTLLVSRVFLGCFEATIGPSLMLISSQWYTKSEHLLKKLLTYAITYLRKPFRQRSVTEKVALLKHVSVNQTGIDTPGFRPREVLEALADPQIWLLVVSVVLLSVSSGVVTTYSATLIKNLGYVPKQAALMNMPSGVVSIFFTLLVGFGIRRQSHRWAWIIVCIIPAVIGGALMSFLNPHTNRSGVLAGIYLVNAVVAPLAVFYNLTVANCAGGTKRAFASALVSGSFSLGNIIGPQTFQARDAPDFRPAKLAVMGTQAACAVTTFALFLYYVWANKRRDDRSRQQEESFMSPHVWTAMTDKENKDFRYTY